MSKALSKYGIYILGFLFLIANCYLYLSKDFYLLNLLPIVLLVIYAAFFALDKLFLFVAFCTPLSLNLEELTGGVGIYLPTEPILLVIMVIFLLKEIKRNSKRDKSVINHPISIAIYFHFAWILITSLTSELPIVSFKFMLSQLWFVIPCFFFGIKIFKAKYTNINNFIWAYTIPLTIVLIVTIAKHATHGFSEETGH